MQTDGYTFIFINIDIKKNDIKAPQAQSVKEINFKIPVYFIWIIIYMFVNIFQDRVKSYWE